jgi:hypothetical protein
MVKKSNIAAKKAIQKSVDNATAGLITRTAPMSAKIVKQKIEDTILDVRYYPAFAGTITRRKDPQAPNKVVGANRDIVDSGDLYASVEVTKTGKGKNTEYEFHLDVPYIEKIEDKFHLSETVRSELML